MADGFLIPVVVFTLFAGFIVICLIYVTKLVKSVSKDTKADVEQVPKSCETTVKKPAKPSGKKKNVERRGAKQNFSHPWLMTSLKGHTGQISDMDFSPNGKYLATCAEAADPGGTKQKPKRKKTSRKQREKTLADQARLDVEACLRHYLLTPRQLETLGYPVESEVFPGRAVICQPFPPYETQEPRCSDSGSGSSGCSATEEDDAVLRDPTIKSEERKCVRCGRGFFLLKDKYLTTERCVYHWGKQQRHHGYSCCGAGDGSPGCVSAKLHVWTGVALGVNGPLDGFVVTQPRKASPHGHGVYAMDCEMCYTSQGLELCKVSVVGIDGKIVYDSYVKPLNPVVDYNTRFSGITSKHLQPSHSVKTLKDVQNDILQFVSADTILIGHALENDLKALKMIHNTVVDTAVAFPHHFGLPYKLSLRSLVATVLQRDIQNGSHDSAEDALACIHLMLFRLACDFRQFSNKSL